MTNKTPFDLKNVMNGVLIKVIATAIIGLSAFCLAFIGVQIHEYNKLLTWKKNAGDIVGKKIVYGFIDGDKYKDGSKIPETITDDQEIEVKTEGSGFTAKLHQKGIYIVKFDTPFSENPIITATGEGIEGETIVAVSDTSLDEVKFTTSGRIQGSESLTNLKRGKFYFIAIGESLNQQERVRNSN